MPTQFQAV